MGVRGKRARGGRRCGGAVETQESQKGQRPSGAKQGSPARKSVAPAPQKLRMAEDAGTSSGESVYTEEEVTAEEEEEEGQTEGKRLQDIPGVPRMQ